MISLNLLPDIKQEHLKSLRRRNSVIAISTIISLVSISILVIMGIFIGGQILAKNTLNSDIQNKFQEISSEDDFNSFLTIQAQANNIDGLKESSPVASRLIDYIKKVNPAAPNNILIDTMDIDFSTTPVTSKITASAANSEAVVVYLDTLRKAKMQYYAGDEEDSEIIDTKLITDIALASSTKSTSNGRITFVVNITFNDLAFDRTIRLAPQIVCVSTNSDPKICEKSAEEKPYANDEQQATDTGTNSDNTEATETEGDDEGGEQ